MKSLLETKARRILRAAQAYKFNREHAGQAAAILMTIEGERGKTDGRLLAMSEAYARDVLGHARYAPWLKVYTAVAGAFKEGWIPDNYYADVVIPKMKGLYGVLSDMKGMTNILFGKDSFPDIAYYVNGLFSTSGGTPLMRNQVAQLLFNGNSKVVFKIDNSLQGKGIYFFNSRDFDLRKISALGNGVFQSYIEQHEALERFAPASVATIRVTTVSDDAGACSVRCAYLRLGRATDTHVQSGTHIRVPLDSESGMLKELGYFPNWLTTRMHPDTQVAFADYKIPAFEKCMEKALELHRKIPFARCIGWDASIDKDENVRFMEWNGVHNDIKFSEATEGPCFKDLNWESLWR
jgi:hypothetical protein